jgi:hypothetical protein
VAPVLGPVGQRVGARHGRLGPCREGGPTGDLPGLAKAIGDVDVAEIERVGRRGDLHEIAGPEVTRVVRRQRHHDFPDERGQHADGGDRAFEAAARAEDVVGHRDGAIAAQARLAGEPDMVAPLLRGEDAAFGRQRLPRAFAGDGDPAEAAGPRSAAGRRDQDAALVQHIEQRVAAPGLEVTGRVDRHVERHVGHEHAPQDQQRRGQEDQQKDDRRAAQKHLGHCVAAICAKDAKPSDMRPARMKPIPSPRSPAGRSA